MPPARPLLALLPLALALGGAALLRRGAPAGPEARPSRWQRPTAEVWRGERAWSEAEEGAYAAFVARLGEAVAARRCRRLQDCLRDPAANALYDEDDARLVAPVDCADLPYTLRAYFAFKRDLPFAYVAAVRGPAGGGGAGDDPRYLRRAEPAETRSWQDALTPAALLGALRGTIHSGMLRMPPEEEGGDFYPPVLRRGALRPGDLFYDPNGHVLVVAQIRRDGVVYFIDAHPDSSLTYRRFGAAFTSGPRRLGGGFKRFRPLRLASGRIERARNGELPDLEGEAQWDPAAWRADGPGAPPRRYDEWVRATLAEPDAAVEPERELREQIEALCRGAAERVDAVALAAPLSRRPHPQALPPNIYGATGDWEVYATPSRDARLKAAASELRDTLLGQRAAGADPARLRALFAEEIGRPGCRLRYVGSRGRAVELGVEDVLDRLFRLSFDPYHCPELRWGAPPGSRELGACPDDGDKFRWYDAEARLRNRVSRVYGVPTGLGDGPEAPPPIDPREALR